ncbi:hypothetical protein K440DRAFT_367698 [Wilcoxina mikolae CBS 423.85]|nr:hypothetical protein K440DRAFT_367698 [Wilcoxina mikolae CBS 423.85]
MDPLSLTASIAGIIGLADLIVKYSKLIDGWRDAPSALRRIKETLSALEPVVAELTTLQGSVLSANGFNIQLAAFSRDVQALDKLVDELLEGDEVKMWRRTKWTMRKKDDALEIEARLAGYLREFMMVLAIVNQKSTMDMSVTMNTIASNQPIIHQTVLEVLGVSKEIQTKMISHDSRQHMVATSTSLSTTSASSCLSAATAVSAMSSSKYVSTVTPISSHISVSSNHAGRREFGIRHTAPCPGADPNAPLWTYANCACDRGYGQARYRSYRTMSPYSGRTLDSKYLFEADFTTWNTIFGKFRFAVTVQAQQQGSSWSLPWITITKQNIRPVDAPVFQLAKQGDFEGLVELFRKGEASPHDRTVDGWTPLLFAINEGHFSTCVGLLDEGADVNTTWVALQDPSRKTDTLLFHAISYTQSDEIPCLLLERGADPFYGPDTPESLFEKALQTSSYGRIKASTLSSLGSFLSPPPSQLSHNDNDKKYRPNALQQSLKWGSLAAVQTCLRAGYDVNTLFEPWEPKPGESARSQVPLLFAITFFSSRRKWDDEGWTFFNRGAVLKELMLHGVDLNLREPIMEWNILHSILSGIDWNSGGEFQSEPLSYPILCQLLVYFLKSGADPRAVDSAGRTPSRVAWDSRLSLRSGNIVERRVLLWYRALRMCGLEPWDYDDRYDERYDTVNPLCHFCTGETTPFIACPWCISLPYGVDYLDNDGWRHKLRGYLYSSEDNLDNLGPMMVREEDLIPCCPIYACDKHCPPVSQQQMTTPMYDGVLETAKGFRLPMRSGGEMLEYDMTGLTLGEIQQRFPRFVSKYAKFLALPAVVEQNVQQVLPSEDGNDGGEDLDDAEEEEFYDAVE